MQLKDIDFESGFILPPGTLMFCKSKQTPYHYYIIFLILGICGNRYRHIQFDYNAHNDCRHSSYRTNNDFTLTWFHRYYENFLVQLPRGYDVHQ